MHDPKRKQKTFLRLPSRSERLSSHNLISQAFQSQINIKTNSMLPTTMLYQIVRMCQNSSSCSFISPHNSSSRIPPCSTSIIASTGTCSHKEESNGNFNSAIITCARSLSIPHAPTFTMRDMYIIRMKAQKAEFCGIWVMLSLNIIAMILRKNSSTSTNNQDSAGQLDLASFLYEISVFYIKASLISRFLVYVFDFANARKKMGYLKNARSFAGFPLWLVFHHGGVYLSHCIVAFFIMAQNHFHCALLLAILQSTHNTWTKKYSKVLYWGNVLLGVLSTYVYVVAKWQDATWACLSMILMMLVVDMGIALLFMESFGIGTKKIDTRKVEKKSKGI